jgi:LemA protein
MTVLIVILVIIAIIALWAWGVYNRLVRLKNQVTNAWSQIDVQLQRRYDLIPNLIETVKGYMTYEKSTLEAVIGARNRASQSLENLKKEGGPTEGSLKELIAAESTLKGSLGQIFALAENYPQLRATENMQRLQEELSSTENKVAFARQAYNDAAMTYNINQQEFPALLVANAFGHKQSDLFNVEEPEAKKAVKVQF